jgi:glutamate/aspartate transport system permease protein
VTVLRSVPLILVLFWFYFMAPLAIGHPVGALPSAMVAFVLFEAAFYCEIIRAGIGAVPPGQAMAAAASGLRRWQALRLVILPQTLAAMTPLLVNQVIILFQDTSLVYVVSLRDFLTAASVVAGRDDRPVEMYCFVAVVYFVICLAGSRLAGRTRRPVFQ